jgi:hypothetical protein
VPLPVGTLGGWPRVVLVDALEAAWAVGCVRPRRGRSCYPWPAARFGRHVEWVCGVGMGVGGVKVHTQ